MSRGGVVFWQHGGKSVSDPITNLLGCVLQELKNGGLVHDWWRWSGLLWRCGEHACRGYVIRGFPRAVLLYVPMLFAEVTQASALLIVRIVRSSLHRDGVHLVNFHQNFRGHRWWDRGVLLHGQGQMRRFDRLVGFYGREDSLALMRGPGPGVPVLGVVVVHARFEEFKR